MKRENLMLETTFTVRRLTVAVPSVRSFFIRSWNWPTLPG
jgi:hypothetical protein